MQLTHWSLPAWCRFTTPQMTLKRRFHSNSISHSVANNRGINWVRGLMNNFTRGQRDNGVEHIITLSSLSPHIDDHRASLTLRHGSHQRQFILRGHGSHWRHFTQGWVTLGAVHTRWFTPGEVHTGGNSHQLFHTGGKFTLVHTGGV